MTSRPRSVKPRRPSLWADIRGATAIEYGLIISLIVITLVIGIVSVADATSGIWNNVNDKVTRAR